MEWMIPSLQDLPDIAKALVPHIRQYKKVALQGEMGAGKTTLVKAIAKEIEVQDLVSSPTFTLVNEYATAQGDLLYHIDAYRLESVEEAMEIGLEDYFYDDSICFIEWPEKVAPLLPEHTLYLELLLLPDGSRQLNMYDTSIGF